MRASFAYLLVLANLAPLLAAPIARAAWPTDPMVNMPLCTASGDQILPVVASDGAGGVIAVWFDHRGADYDIYAQRITANGQRAWMQDGVPICTAAKDQTYPVILADDTGGAIIAWPDFRDSTHFQIYAQSVGPDGSLRWATDGVRVCAAAGIAMTSSQKITHLERR